MINRIQILNYKSIRDADIKLSNVNIIVGANGVGKSNFICFFELLQAIIGQNLGSYVLAHGGSDRFLYKGPKVSSFIESNVMFGMTNVLHVNLHATIDRKLFISELGDYYNSTRSSQPDYTHWNYKIWDKDVMESGLLKNNHKRISYLLNFMNSFTVYHFHDTSITSPMRKPSDVNDNVCLRQNGSNLASMLYRMSITSPRSFMKLEAVIKSVAPYFKRFRLVPDAYMPNLIHLQWEEEGSDMFLDVASLSDGTLRFIALASILLQEKLPETIIIDEPELGLHPSAINKLAGLIRSASTSSQIIISTQSVNLVNQFDAEEIIVADRCDGQAKFTRLNQSDLGQWIEDYSMGELWEKNIIGGQP